MGHPSMPRWRYTVTDPVPTHCCALQRYKHFFKSKQYEQNYFISERKQPLQTPYRRLLCRVACLDTLDRAIYAAAVAASCLELKDKLKGCYWDWLDWILTVVGGGIAAIIWLFL